MIEKISMLIERDEFLGNKDLKERFKSAQMVKKLNVEKIKTFERFNPDEPYDDEEEE